jgi:hypothetical protein
MIALSLFKRHECSLSHTSEFPRHVCTALKTVFLLTMKLLPSLLYLLSCLCLAQKNEFFSGGPGRRPPMRSNNVYLCECSGKNETAIKCGEKLLNVDKARKIARNPKRTAAVGRCAQTKFLVCRCRVYTYTNGTQVRTCETKKVAAPSIPAQVAKRRVTLGACRGSSGNGTVVTNATKTNSTKNATRFF